VSVLSSQSIRKLCAKNGMVVRSDDKPLSIEPVSIDIHLAELELNGVLYKDGHVFLTPGFFCLGSTIERFKMPDNIVGFVIGKSTNAREGLQIEAAGLIDPHFDGDITLELKNLHHKEYIKLEIGQAIGQVYFLHVDETVDIAYGSDNGNHYQNQQGVTQSYRKQRALTERLNDQQLWKTRIFQ
jgi:dCTP deaminase